MEPVVVRIYAEDSPFKKFGVHYERANGQRTVMATGCSYQHAKDRANQDVYECEWEPFQADRKDGFLETGHGWVDPLETSA
jgi:hypothetical protein